MYNKVYFTMALYVKELCILILTYLATFSISMYFLGISNFQYLIWS